MHDTAPSLRPSARVTWHGKTGALYALLATNILLKIVTLGVFTFWARTRKRLYFWSHVEFDGDRFEYHGRGIELFLGMLFVAAAILLPLGLAQNLLLVSVPQLVQPVIQLAFSIVVAFLAGAGLFRATRYRLTRTAWRGVRFGLDGTTRDFATGYLRRLLLLGVTLSLYRPWYDAWYMSTLINQTRYGDTRVECRPNADGLLGRYLVALLFAVPTLGLSFAYYRLAILQRLAAHTSFAGLTPRFDASLRDLVMLRIGNFLLYVVAGGGALLLAYLVVQSVPQLTKLQFLSLSVQVAFIALGVSAVLPLVWQRRLRFFCTHFTVAGVLDAERIRAGAVDDVETGEGLNAAFEFDAIG